METKWDLLPSISEQKVLSVCNIYTGSMWQTTTKPWIWMVKHGYQPGDYQRGGAPSEDMLTSRFGFDH